MNKVYEHQKYEKEIYKKWETSGSFEPLDSARGLRPFTIIMPPPNANGELHLGHATFVVVSDALIRYHRMKGAPTLWLPGVDHAGILTQVTFEKKLQKEGKSRHDLGREEFYKQCYAFCLENKHLMEDQMRALGSSCDWSREKFTLDPEISKLVLETFVKMHKESLVYRGYRIVNWCVRCRSTLSDLETEEKELTDKLYYLDYGTVTIATTRPETIYADVAVAVHPKGKYKNLIGKTATVPLVNREVPIIGDTAVEKEFGTGALKITPGHDATDYEIGQRHNLPTLTVIDFDGKMIGEVPEEIRGLKLAAAREKTVEFLRDKLLKTEPLVHSVKTCERCETIIEPLISRQWFVKTKELAAPAIKAVREGRVKIVPKKYEKMYFNWMENIRDWPISRQIWWGHQLPAWYKKSDVKLELPTVSIEKPGDDWIQDPDTFDTWFSSGQWPFTTLRAGQPGDFDKYYPTTVMNTAYEILFLWVARMIMFGLYLTGKVPFEIALINGVLRDENGAKMSKSKGNGVNPNEAIAKYGADAVRMALVAGRDNGNDLLISKQQMEERIRGYRNFANKIWNASRFVQESGVRSQESGFKIQEELDKTISDVTKKMDKMQLGMAAELVYDKFWHWYCDVVIEKAKTGKVSKDELRHGLEVFLKLLHPFMPFVTEAVWRELGFPGQLIGQAWPR
ncbi:MAG: Valine-tRNA ligase [Candidatus Amesbacteria bacterium GW2011_GWA2_47_11b]|uniref:Valine--tRNA ligase n=1 Tax=Candidatus Amesbacteria bacterium GW2011_GWA2_47_11b TaxID=1618358 RepID=A0A0G1RLV3_9BACT|nr:MAG: Valine-tRNA ligase [Candidatus Amesbacteria bacterium GW2011_GWA2_47_11b]